MRGNHQTREQNSITICFGYKRQADGFIPLLHEKYQVTTGESWNSHFQKDETLQHTFLAWQNSSAAGPCPVWHESELGETARTAGPTVTASDSVSLAAGQVPSCWGLIPVTLTMTITHRTTPLAWARLCFSSAKQLCPMKIRCEVGLLLFRKLSPFWKCFTLGRQTEPWLHACSIA